MAKARISTVNHGTKFIVSERVTNERTHHGERDLLVRLTRHCGDLIGGQRRHRLGHIQATIGRKTCHHGLFKCQRRGATTGRNITHRLGVLGL